MAMQIISCIYKIENTVNGKCYIGSAVNFLGRRRAHRSVLGKNKHHSEKLQRAWNKYGSDVFVFVILEVVADARSLISREQHWIDSVKPDYNILKFAGSRLGMRHSKVTKEKMSDLRRGKPLLPTHRAGIVAANTGRPMRSEHKARLLSMHLGVPHSIETRSKMSLAHTGTKQSLERIALSVNARARNREIKAAMGVPKITQSAEHVAMRVAKMVATKARKKLERNALLC